MYDIWQKMIIPNVVGIGIKAGFYKWHNHFIFRSTDANYTHFLFGELIILYISLAIYLISEITYLWRTNHSSSQRIKPSNL